MNYYEHHLGDYARDAGHLSLIEDGTYRRLIDAYYARESALPLDMRECKKLARVTRNPAEHRAVEYVLREFFVAEDDGYHQKRCDEEIQRFKEKRLAAKASANARWGCDRNANASDKTMRTHSERINGQMRTHVDRNANAMLSSLQSPVSNVGIPTPTLPAEQEGLIAQAQGGGRRINGTNPRALGTSPRSLGTNPRALGTNLHAARDQRKGAQDEARLVWTELIRSDGARPKRNHQIQAALDAIGGWSAVRLRTEADSNRLLREFCQAYAQEDAHADG